MIGDGANASGLEAVVRELVGRLGVRVQLSQSTKLDLHDVVTPRSEPEPVLAHVWLDVSRAGRATLYLSDERWTYVLVREVPRSARGDEVAREALGHILEASVEALLAGEHVGVAREEARRSLGLETTPPPAPPRPPAPPPAPSAFGLSATVGYEAQAHAPDAAIVHGPVLGARVASPYASGRLGGWTTVQYRWPTVIDGGPVGARLEALCPRVGASFDVLSGARTRLWLDLGGGVDLTWVEPRRAAAQDVVPGAERMVLVPQLRTAIGLGLVLVKGLAVFAELAIETDPTQTRFVLDDAGAHRDVLAPHAVRPSLQLSLAAPGGR